MSIRRRDLLGLTALLVIGACARGRSTAPKPAARDTGTVAARPAPRDTAVPFDTSHGRQPPPMPVTLPDSAKAPGKKGPSDKRCVLDLENRDPTRAQVNKDPMTGKYVAFVGGGISGRCRGQDITIEADSSENYDPSSLYILIGNVHYREPAAAIDAQRATYYRQEERILFENAVRVAQRKGGGVLVGPRVEYFRQVAGVRPRPRAVATMRPTLTYSEKDSLGRDQPPVTMNANVIIGEGDSTYFGVGDVRLLRNELLARGDSATVDANKKTARLLRGPVIESTGSQPFTLHGHIIDLFGSGREVDRILALDSAKAVSKDLTLVSDTIDLRVSKSRLDRAFAFGATGASATTPERTVLADSLDIIMPGQRIRELHAIGKAYVESDPDSTKVHSDERDWLRGDTIIAHFDSATAKDSASRPQMRDVTAAGQASSFYQSANKADKKRPALSYNRGRVIHLDFAKGEVETVTVIDKSSGVYLEPSNDTTAVNRGRRGGAPPVVPPRRRPPDPQSGRRNP
jgi:lipopolysaccharide export system protein LptA